MSVISSRISRLGLAGGRRRQLLARVLVGGALACASFLALGTVRAQASTVGTLSVIGGTGTPGAPTPGPATSSELHEPFGVAVDDSTGDAYIADTNNDEIEEIDSAGTLSVFVGTSSNLASPTGVAVDDATGDVYIALQAGNEVDQVTPSGTLSVIAGTGTVGAPTAGPATSSDLDHPFGVAVDAITGDVYVADLDNNEIEQITSAGTLSVIAGTGAPGVPTPGPATSSDLSDPVGVAVDDATGDVYTDTDNGQIEQITSAGTLSVIAGTGAPGAPTPGPATSSDLSSPRQVAVNDATGDVYIADSDNNEIEQVTSAGTLSVIAGTGTGGPPTPGPATSSDLSDPFGVAVDDATGDVYTADSDNNEIEQVTPPIAAPAPTSPTATSFTTSVNGATSASIASGATATLAEIGLPDTATGTVTFVSGNTTLCTLTLNGLATEATSCATSTSLPAGTYSVSAAFAPTGTSYAGSTATNTATLTVSSASTPLPDISTAAGARLAADPTGSGYWVLGTNGAVAAVGGATSYGSMVGRALNAPIVGITATPNGGGYWLVASDGGVFSFGDAAFFGSEGGQHLNAPIVGITATPNGGGYWLVASDGGVFSFGDAAFFGSEGGQHLNAPIVGITAAANGGGYWLVASDGGVFSFGDAAYLGSEAATSLSAPVVGMAATPNGGGYWLVASDGGVFTFGDATFYGSEGGAKLSTPALGLIVNPTGTAYQIVNGAGTATEYQAA
jgi:DNA-binding beta-propeller fold protein YncE